MATGQLERRSAAADELGRLRGDLNAHRVVESLCDGMDLITDLLFTRIDRDVEQRFGMDSMVMPASTQGEIRASTRARHLIDIYAAILAAEEASEQGYMGCDGLQLTQWFLQLRVEAPLDPSARQRIDKWQTLDADERRRQFASALERRMPHATNAPLIVHRLFPLGVRMTVAIAFGDHLRAGELRNRQITLLPVIADCHGCHGNPLDNGDACPTCGNPLWQYDWLCAAD